MGQVHTAPYTSTQVTLSQPSEANTNRNIHFTDKENEAQNDEGICPITEPRLVSNYNRAQTWLCLLPYCVTISRGGGGAQRPPPEEGFNNLHPTGIQDSFHKPTSFTLFLTRQRALHTEEELRVAESRQRHGPNCLAAAQKPQGPRP